MYILEKLLKMIKKLKKIYNFLKWLEETRIKCMIDSGRGFMWNKNKNKKNYEKTIIIVICTNKF